VFDHWNCFPLIGSEAVADKFFAIVSALDEFASTSVAYSFLSWWI